MNAFKQSELDLFSSPLVAGKTLVEANAGSGKTTALVWVFLRLCLEKEILPRNIVLVTFTNKAAKEIRTRLEQEIGWLQKWWVFKKMSTQQTLSQDEAAKTKVLYSQMKANWPLFCDAEKYLDKHWQKKPHFLAPLFPVESAFLCIGTIHAFIQKLFHDFPFLSDYAVRNEQQEFYPELFQAAYKQVWDEENAKQDDDDRFLAVKPEALAEMWQAQQQYYGLRFVYPANLQHSSKEQAGVCEQAEQQARKKIEMFYRVKELYNQNKQEAGCLDFNDFFDKLLKVCSNEKYELLLQNLPYQALLVDEFQDTDARQLDLFDHLFADKPEQTKKKLSDTTRYQIFVGDPKQSLYSFRGADLDLYFQTKQEILASATDHFYRLTTNYRSQPRYIDGINHLFNETSWKLPKVDYVSSRTPQKESQTYNNQQTPAPIQFVLFQFSKKNIDQKTPQASNKNLSNVSKEQVRNLVQQAAVACVQDMLTKPIYNNQPIAPKDLCILVRTNKSGRQFAALLRKAGIAVSDFTEQQFSNSDHWVNMQQFLYALETPESLPPLKSFLASSWFCYPVAEIAQLQNSGAFLQHLRSGLQQASKIFAKRGLLAALSVFLSHIPTEKFAITAADFPSLDAAFLAVEKLQHERGIINLRQHFHQLIRSSEFKPAALSQGVSIFSIHRAKGLEFSFLFCLDLWEQNAASPLKTNIYKDQQSWVFDLRQKKNAEQKAAYENYNLLYTALTRGKKGCWIVVPDFQTSRTSMEKSYLGFLLQRDSLSLKESVLKLCSEKPLVFACQQSVELDLLRSMTSWEGIITPQSLNPAMVANRRVATPPTPSTVAHNSVGELSVAGEQNAGTALQNNRLQAQLEATQLDGQGVDLAQSGAQGSAAAQSDGQGIDATQLDGQGVAAAQSDGQGSATTQLGAQGIEAAQLDGQGSAAAQSGAQGVDLAQSGAQGVAAAQLDGQGSEAAQLDGQGSAAAQLDGQGIDAAQLDGQGVAAAQLDGQGIDAAQLGAQGSAATQLDGQGSATTQSDTQPSVAANDATQPAPPADCFPYLSQRSIAEHICSTDQGKESRWFGDADFLNTYENWRIDLLASYSSIKSQHHYQTSGSKSVDFLDQPVTPLPTDIAATGLDLNEPSWAESNHAPHNIQPDLSSTAPALDHRLGGQNFDKGRLTGLFFHDLIAHWNFDCAALLGYQNMPHSDLLGKTQQHFVDNVPIEKRLEKYGLSPMLVASSISSLLHIQHFHDFLCATNDLTAVFPCAEPDKLLLEWGFTIDLAAWPKKLMTTLLPQPFESLFQYRYLIGRIDACWVSKNRIVLIDWKTDHVGDQADHYSEKNLRLWLKQQEYILQNRVYLFALGCHFASQNLLKQFLQAQVQSYFVFLRGLSWNQLTNTNARFGICPVDDQDFWQLLKTEMSAQMQIDLDA